MLPELVFEVGKYVPDVREQKWVIFAEQVGNEHLGQRSPNLRRRVRVQIPQVDKELYNAEEIPQLLRRVRNKARREVSLVLSDFVTMLSPVTRG
eukprot:1643337-Prymnesium_polylepis.2